MCQTCSYNKVLDQGPKEGDVEEGLRHSMMVNIHLQMQNFRCEETNQWNLSVCRPRGSDL